MKLRQFSPLAETHNWVVDVSHFIRILSLSLSDQVSCGDSSEGRGLGIILASSLYFSSCAFFPVGPTESELSDLPIQAVRMGQQRGV